MPPHPLLFATDRVLLLCVAGDGGQGSMAFTRGAWGAVMQEQKLSRDLGMCSGGQQVGAQMLG